MKEGVGMCQGEVVAGWLLLHVELHNRGSTDKVIAGKIRVDFVQLFAHFAHHGVGRISPGW